MAEFFAIRVDAWRAFVRSITTGTEELRLNKWSRAFVGLREACWPQRLSPVGSFGMRQRLLTDDDVALLSARRVPDLADPRLARTLRRILLGTATHALTTYEPRLSATLGVAVPTAGLFRDDSDRAQWQLLVDTWVYRKQEPPADLWFLADADAYCGLASPEVVHDLLGRDETTGLLRRVAAYYCGEGGELSVIQAFLELARVQRLWVYFTEAAT